MLISGKLCVPTSSTRLLFRSSLVERFSRGTDKGLVLVSGPAGSGKTSLVCQWISQEGRPVAWYSLDEADNQPDVFFTYLLTALSGLDKSLADRLRPWLDGREEVRPLAIVSILLELLADLPEDVYLVLDGYHAITSKEIHTAVACLLDHLPPRVHLVLVARYAVSLPVARLRTRNQVAEISSRDLKFSQRETERFFSEVCPAGLSAGRMQELHRRMEGWAAGLLLFATTLEGRSGASAFHGALAKASANATDYLVHEVINHQPGKVRRFLYATSLLDRFNADLCAAVTGRTDASEVLDRVWKNDLFLIPLDAEKVWYRYHHLFCKSAREKATTSSPDQCRRIHKVAALWFGREGYPEEAFHHAFASRDMEFAADVLENHLMTLYRRGDVASCKHWLSKLAQPVFLNRPLLRLHDLRFRIWSVRLFRVEAILDDIERGYLRMSGGFDDEKRKFCEDSFVLFRTILPSWLRPEAADVATLERVASSLDWEDRYFAGMVRMMIASSYLHQGDITKAYGVVSAARAVPLHPESPFPPFVWFRMMASLERFRGHLARSEAVLKDAFLYLDRKGLSQAPPRKLLFLPMAWISYYRNDLDKALNQATAALRYVEQTGIAYEIVEGNYLLSLTYGALGDIDRSRRCMVRMEREAASMGMDGWLALTDACVARLSLSHGNVDRAIEWAGRRKLGLDEPFTFRYVAECLAQAEIYYATGSHTLALRVLKRLNSLCARYGMVEGVLESDLLAAAVCLATGNRREAEALLEKALEIGRPEGYIRPFAAHGPALFPLLTDKMTRRRTSPSDPYIEKILKSSGLEVRKAVSGGRGGAKDAVGLTRREMDILGMIADGYDNREIAEKAFISLNTVKTHAKHIFAKLDARTRVQAIKRVEELGLR